MGAACVRVRAALVVVVVQSLFFRASHAAVVVFSIPLTFILLHSMKKLDGDDGDPSGLFGGSRLPK